MFTVQARRLLYNPVRNEDEARWLKRAVLLISFQRRVWGRSFARDGELFTGSCSSGRPVPAYSSCSNSLQHKAKAFPVIFSSVKPWGTTSPFGFLLLRQTCRLGRTPTVGEGPEEPSAQTRSAQGQRRRWRPLREGMRAKTLHGRHKTRPPNKFKLLGHTSELRPIAFRITNPPLPYSAPDVYMVHGNTKSCKIFQIAFRGAK